MDVVVTNTPAIELVNKLIHTIESHDGDVLCFTAGGSALKIFDTLQLTEDTKRRTTFCMGDERVSGEGSINNYRQLISRLGPGHNFLILDTCAHTGEKPTDFALRIETEISKIISAANNLKIISVQGVGTDGHTAGIFPLPEDMFSNLYTANKMYVSVELPELEIASRASVTPSWILNNVDMILAYITGESKVEILSALTKTDVPLSTMPAQMLRKHPNSFVFTDISSVT